MAFDDDATAISEAVMKAIKSSQLGTIRFEQVPSEICIGETVDLSRWSMVLTDKNLEYMATFPERNSEYNYLDSTKGTLREMFSTFWTRQPSVGVLRLNIGGAKDVTDYGVACIARHCPLLKELKMNGCVSIGDAGLREVGLRCRSLHTLHMASCHNIEGGGLVAVSECCNALADVDISQCRKLQRWAIHKLFSGCTKLEEIKASHLMCIGDEEVRVLAQHNPHLISFVAVESVNISDTAVLALSQHCFDLELLDLSRKQMATRITDVSLLALGERSLSLRVLNVNGCDSISDVGLNWLSIGCVALEILDLGGCTKITDAGLRSIGSSCHSLHSVNIANAKYVSDVGIASISSGCPKLQHLTCSGLYLLADPRFTPLVKKSAGKRSGKKSADGEEPWNAIIGIAALSKKCPEMSSLDVSGCFRLNNVLKKNLARGLTKLTKICLVGCNQAESASFVAVAEGCTLLEEINLSDCGSAVNTSVMQAFSANCPNLKVIELARCENVRGGAVKAISRCENLEKLDLSGCQSLVDSSIISICEVDKVPNLKSLYLMDIPAISDTSLAWISTGCSNLQIVCFKGTGITRQSCRAVKDSFPYSDLIYNHNFAGFWPKSRLKDRILMNEYYKVEYGVTCIQSFARKMIAKRRVQTILETLRIFRCATTVQRCMRIIKAKREVLKKKEELKKRKWYVLRIIGILRMAVARHRVKKLRQKRVSNYRSKKATIIQVAYRNYRTKKTVLRMQKAFFEMIRKRRWAIVVLQNMCRMFKDRRRFRQLQEFVLAQTRVRRIKIVKIQAMYRGYVARYLVYNMREHLNFVHETRINAATKIQRLVRALKTNKLLAAGLEVKRRRLRGAIKLQAAMRGKLARLEFTIRLIEMSDAQEDFASRKIQNRWRVKKAMLLVAQLLMERRRELQRKADAVTTFSKYWRSRDARLLLRELRFQRDEAIRLRVEIEYLAAIKLQSLFRGVQGRKLFDEKLREKKGKWKELMDEDTGKRFFYNKLTGEIRWRMPQDLLDLIPRPTCDNCERFEAGVECGVCNEFFCHKCWGVIHHGGRRKDHEFRALFDYYGKRIDYGDGNYPCKWPSEVQQDDVQGWMLRVAPIRNPVAVYGDWEHYFTSREEDPNYDTYVKEEGSSFFFNRKTFEATYDAPPELEQTSEQIEDIDMSASAAYDATAYEATGFQSTYDGTYAETSYDQSAALGFDQSNTFDGSMGYYDTSGTWVTDYDKSTRYGQTQYDPSQSALSFDASQSYYE